mmetsp:Transcript_17167/g.40960  ORF Transcript_17167/g.40960 Transcript_17167/m.40960 type:complete len:220 (+) Transcript_17167:1896-2555(+)
MRVGCQPRSCGSCSSKKGSRWQHCSGRASFPPRCSPLHWGGTGTALTWAERCRAVPLKKSPHRAPRVDPKDQTSRRQKSESPECRPSDSARSLRWIPPRDWFRLPWQSGSKPCASPRGPALAGRRCRMARNSTGMSQLTLAQRAVCPVAACWASRGSRILQYPGKGVDMGLAAALPPAAEVQTCPQGPSSLEGPSAGAATKLARHRGALCRRSRLQRRA